jgi:hypothetical protein
VKDVGAIDKEHRAIGVGYHGDGNGAHLCASKGLAKDLPFPYDVQEVSVAVIIHPLGSRRAGKKNGYVFGGGSFCENRIFFIKTSNPCTKACQHSSEILAPNAGKKGARFKKIKIFFHDFSVC